MISLSTLWAANLFGHTLEIPVDSASVKTACPCVRFHEEKVK